MATNTSRFLLERLADDWGVRRVYGYPGDGIGGLTGAFHDVGDRLAFTQVRHEEIAAFAATAHAKLTGEVGVCLATSGPGAIHLLNGLYDAKLDHQPVLAIVGQQARASMGSDFQQEVDLVSLFKDVAGAFVQTLMVPQQAAHLLDRAMRIAKATRSPTCIIVPSDVQELPYEAPARVHGETTSSSAAVRRPRVVPDATALQQAADVLNAGRRVAILVGAGARRAAEEVEQVAELLGAGVAKALNGRTVLPDDLPWVTGSIGLLGTKPSWDLMEGCDTLLMVGSSFPYSEWLPEPGSARGVQIDIDARQLGIRYPMEVNLAGDAADTLAALAPLLTRKDDRSWREEIEGNVARWWRVLEEQAHEPAHPINPRLLFHELSPRLPDRAILPVDTGSVTDWWARHLRVRRGMDSMVSGTLASMGPGVPYALAAKLAAPDRPVITVVGDGAMQMLGNAALIDVMKFADEFEDQVFVVCVLNNGDLNQVTWEQRVMSGDAKLEASQVLPAFDYAAYGRMLGMHGVRVESPGDLGAAWDDVLTCGRPAVLDVVCDPEVPPLPPHVTFEQARALAGALRHGDPGARDVIRHGVRGKLAEFLTR